MEKIAFFSKNENRFSPLTRSIARVSLILARKREREMKTTAAPRPRAQTPMPTTVNNTTNNQCTINNINNYITNYFQRCQPVEAVADAATTTEPEEKTRPQANEEEPTEQRESKKQKTSDEPKKGKLMTSFFSRAEGPTRAEDDDPRPPHLFPRDERKHTFEKINHVARRWCFPNRR